MTENNKKPPKPVFTVLCIDGGGVRGMIPARILEEIEAKTGKPIFELFDLVGGPSTGSIVAAGLTVPDPKDPTKAKLSAKDIKQFYYDHCPKIFPPVKMKSLRQLSNGALYNPKPLEEALEGAFGDAKVRDCLTSIMVPATDIKTFHPAWISHFKGEKDSSAEGWSSMLLKDAIRVSTAAPTFFPTKYVTTTPNDDMPNVTHRHALVDGGFLAGNLMPRMLAEARRLAPPDAEIVMVHLSTGTADNSLSPEEYNKLGPLGFVSQSKGNILMSLIITLSLRDSCEMMKGELGDKFISFEGLIPLDKKPDLPAIAMDKGTPENLQKLEKFAEKILEDHAADFDRMIGRLNDRLDYKASQPAQAKPVIDQVVELMRQKKSLGELGAFHDKICAFAADPAAPVDDADAAVATLARQMTAQDIGKMQSVYRALQQDLINDRGIKGIFNDVRGALKKLGGKKDADNDNDASADKGQGKKKKGPFWRP